MKRSNTSRTGIGSDYTKRDQKVYALFENELDTLSNYTNVTIVASAVGSFFLHTISERFLDKTQAIVDYYPFVIICVLSYIFAGWNYFKKKGLAAKIKSQTTVIESPGKK